MALPPSGSLRESVELLRIETDLFDLYLKGKPFHPTVEALQLHRTQDEEWVESTLEVIPAPGLQLKTLLVFSPQRGEMLPFGDGPALPIFFEHQNYELVLQKKSEAELTFHHDNILLRRAVKPLGKDLLVGVLNFQSEVGYTDLEIRLRGHALLNLRLEIFPSKMDYRRDYQRILAEVNEQIYNLAFDFLRKTYQLTGLRETTQQSLTEFFTILRLIFNQLTAAVERIRLAPHHRLVPVHEVRRTDQVKRAGRANSSFLAKHPQSLVEDPEQGFLNIADKRYTPTHLLETRRQVDYATAENRFLRWMLLRIQVKLKEIRQRLLQLESLDPVLLKSVEGMLAQLSRLANLDFLRDVGEMKQISITLVLQMAPGYRDVYRGAAQGVAGETTAGESAGQLGCGICGSGPGGGGDRDG